MFFDFNGSYVQLIYINLSLVIINHQNVNLNKVKYEFKVKCKIL